MGNTCKPMAVSFQCMTKFTTHTHTKTQHSKTKIMAPCPFASWRIEGEKWKEWQILFSWAKMSLQIGLGSGLGLWNWCLFLGRKAMTNLDNILKSRDITLQANVQILKAMVFPVVTQRCKSWTLKKAEHWKIYAFKLWCCSRLLRVPWTARISNQSILMEINPEYSFKDSDWG